MSAADIGFIVLIVVTAVGFFCAGASWSIGRYFVRQYMRGMTRGEVMHHSLYCAGRHELYMSPVVPRDIWIEALKEEQHVRT